MQSQMPEKAGLRAQQTPHDAGDTADTEGAAGHARSRTCASFESSTDSNGGGAWIAAYLAAFVVGASDTVSAIGAVLTRTMGSMGSMVRTTPARTWETRGVTVVCISDTHGQHRKIKDLPPGDILIHAGDFTRFGRVGDATDFNDWLGELPHTHKIVVNGNHECNAAWQKDATGLLTNATFLKQRAVVCEGLTIFGTDFFWPMETANPYLAQIPADVDILVTHGPPRGHVDNACGCKTLKDCVDKLQPRVVVCGQFSCSCHRGLGAYV